MHEVSWQQLAQQLHTTLATISEQMQAGKHAMQEQELGDSLQAVTALVSLAGLGICRCTRATRRGCRILLLLPALQERGD